MSSIILKYKFDEGKEYIKMFKNDASCDRFIEQTKNDKIIGTGFTVVSRNVDNRAPKTIKRLLEIPKRGSR